MSLQPASGEGAAKRLVIALVAIAALYLVYNWLGDFRFQAAHGERLDVLAGELYHRDVDEELAQQLAAALTEAGVFRAERGAVVKLTRVDGVYWVGIQANREAVEADIEQSKLQFVILGMGMAGAFAGEPFTLHLCDEGFVSFLEIPGFGPAAESEEAPAPPPAERPDEPVVPSIGAADSSG